MINVIVLSLFVNNNEIEFLDLCNVIHKVFFSYFIAKTDHGKGFLKKSPILLWGKWILN